MAVLGRTWLLLALVVCMYGIGASLYRVRSGREVSPPARCDPANA